MYRLFVSIQENLKKLSMSASLPLQLPNTLAEILNVPKPSAILCEILPDLFDMDYR